MQKHSIEFDPRAAHFKFSRFTPMYNWTHPLKAEKRISNSQNQFARIAHEGVKRRALYVHIPFCDTICTFCTLSRIKTDRDLIAMYVDALVEEMRIKREHFESSRFDTIYFGGGTPSVLTPEQILRIGRELRANFDLSGLIEFNFECELKSMTPDVLHALREIGVNKPRFGLQTFHPEQRAIFNLTSTPEQIQQVSAMVKQLFPHPAFDMLYGLNAQTPEDFAADIEAAAALGINNIDWYPICNVATQSALHRAYDAQGMQPASGMQKYMFTKLLYDIMKSHGYLPHNGHGYVKVDADDGRYFTERYRFHYYADFVYGPVENEIIGLGASGISCTRTAQIMNEVDVKRYIKSVLQDCVIPEHISDHPVPYEKVLVQTLPYSLRVAKSGIPLERIDAGVLQRFEEMIAGGYIVDEGDSYSVSREGFFWYTNMMYYLTTDDEKAILDSFIVERLSQETRKDGPMETPLVFRPRQQQAHLEACR